jgi:hypothetical protein
MKVRVLALCAGLVLGGCGPALDTGPMPKLLPVAWSDGETAVFNATRNDSVLYTTTIVTTLDEESGTQPGAVEPVPTVTFTIVTQTTPEGEFVFDSAEVVCRRDSLLPLRSTRQLETSVAEFHVTAAYSPGRVAIRKETIDGATEDVLAVPRRTYALDAVQALLRTVPLDPGVTFRTTLCIPIEFRTFPAKVQVLGTKLVPTGIGDVMCREIALVSPGRELRYWFELAEPHRYVGMQDPVSGTQSVIVSYSVPSDSVVPRESLP